MKHKQKILLLRIDNEQLRDAENKIELLSCPHGGKSCEKNLSVINNNFAESRIYRKAKDYTRSIYALQHAFIQTSELKESKCATCSGLFRATITQSLKKIQDELYGMSTGLFRMKKYQGSYTLAGTVLNSFKCEESNYQANPIGIHEPLREVG